MYMVQVGVMVVRHLAQHGLTIERVEMVCQYCCVIYYCVLAVQTNPILLRELWIGVLMSNPKLKWMREELALNAKFWTASL